MEATRLRKHYLALARRRTRPGSGSQLAFLRTRTAMQPIPNLLATFKRTPFLIVGGIATRLYMPEQLIQDVDVLVLAQDAPSAYQELMEAGARQLGTLSIGGTTWALPDGVSNHCAALLSADEIERRARPRFS